MEGDAVKKKTIEKDRAREAFDRKRRRGQEARPRTLFNFCGWSWSKSKRCPHWERRSGEEENV